MDHKVFWRILFSSFTAFFILIFFFLIESVSAATSDDFVITVQTDNDGTSPNNQFTIPTFSGETYNYNVDCDNDGTNDWTGQTGDVTCIYSTAGNYTIRIKDNSGTGTGFPRIYFNGEGDAQKLLSIDQWGTGHWTSMAHAFEGCTEVNGDTSDTPDLSAVTDLSYMFADANTFNQPIGDWDTSNVTNMSAMFHNAFVFNQPIGNWNTSNVVSMLGMFAGTFDFNQNITEWNTISVTNMHGMFWFAMAFNQPIGTWDTSNVYTMWRMFSDASSFDQDLGNWDVSALNNAEYMFENIALSTPNYDALLTGWDPQDLQSGVSFDGGYSNYCAGESARQHMVDIDDWTITDGGKSCPTTNNDFVITVKTDNDGISSDTQFTIPTYAGETYNYNVDCDNDGTEEDTAITGNYTCNYASPGTYTVRIKDNTGIGTGFPRINFSIEVDNDKLLSIDQWGTGKWTSMEYAFWSCSKLAGQASDVPDLSNVSSMRGMFEGAAAFNQDISDWDTSNVIDMSFMFSGAFNFNQDISSWDTSNVIDMSMMFRGAPEFIDLPSVFNQDIGDWDTSKVTDMSGMFKFANAFDQNIGSWNVSSVQSMSEMFTEVKLSTLNYDALLIGWDAQSLQPNVTFDGGNSTFCYGGGARQHIIASDGWTITDFGKNCPASYDFVITVKTDNDGTSSNTQFSIPIYNGENYNYNVDCDSDGSYDWTAQTEEVTCSYSIAGTYTIRISDNSGIGSGFPRIFFNGGGDAQKLIHINQWGANPWASMAHAFQGCSNLTSMALDTPDLSNVTELRYMFSGASAFNQPIGDWDTSSITNMDWMFWGAAAFNQTIGGWDTGNVVDMGGMFYDAIAFNQPIGDWDTSGVSNMGHMFYNASSFDQPIGNWNTSNVTTMNGMFMNAVHFNRPIGGWDTSSVTTMNGMFMNAGSFDQDLSSWDVSALVDAEDLFDNISLSTPNYDALLIGWDEQELQPDVPFDGGNSNYCYGEGARQHMIDSDSWTITDGGKYCTFTNDFVITVQTDNPGWSSDTQFTIPIYMYETYNYNVDCDNDGLNEWTGQTGEVVCSYSTVGTYTIRIKDNSGAETGFPRIYFNGEGDAEKLLSIDQWGTGHWTSMAHAFEGCVSVNGDASDTPDLSAVTDLSFMFAGATSFNQSIENWDTSNVTDMHWMFYNASNFNQPIGNWNTSKVTNMNRMFYRSISFNQPIGEWYTSNVINMGGLFQGASAFDQPIGSWNTSSVTGMTDMFRDATSFNQHISDWDTSKVTIMSGMFWNATSFNQPIGEWDTHNVNRMVLMFSNATAFDQDLGNWDVSALQYADDMFTNIALSTVNYDALLIGWDAQDLVSDVNFSGGNSTYCLGESARQNMIDSDGWAIIDGGKSCPTAYDDFVITVYSYYPGDLNDPQFTIPTYSGETYNYNVDCDNDGTDEATAQSGDYTCKYSSIGSYTIRIKDNSGTGNGFPRIYFNNSGDNYKLLSIDQWGGNKWTSMEKAFYGCYQITGQAIDVPDLSNVTNMSYMFAGASIFNQFIGDWDTSNVTNMDWMFWNAYSFDQDMSDWNVSALSTAENMFSGIALSTPNYDALLIGWDEQELQPDVPFDGGNSTYCAGESARQHMIDSDGWTIIDGGKNCNLPGSFFKTTPIDAATYVSPSPILEWGSSSGATTYEYCFDTTNDDACSEWFDNGNNTSKALSGLSAGTTFFWHVRAINAQGTTYANGSETAFWSFTSSETDSVVMVLDPQQSFVSLGETFELVVQIQAPEQFVDGGSAYLNFDPTKLQVVSITPGTSLPTQIQNQYDNLTGQIDYSYGTFSDFPSGTFTLATVTFEAIATTESTLVSFNIDLPRKSDLTYEGYSILDITQDGTVAISESAELAGSVDLQGRPPLPDSSWSIPLQLNLIPIGETTPLYTFNPTTDEYGEFTIPDIFPDTYTINIKNSHTLQNCQEVSFSSGLNTINFGVLREGDVNDDNCVTMVDFSVLVGTFGVCEGEGGFDPRADFNEDGCVSIVDFSLLRPNFGSCGDCEPVGMPLSFKLYDVREDVSISIEPALSIVDIGDQFTVSVQINSGSQPVDGVAAYINFDPIKLQVISVTPGTTLPIQIQNQYDNLVGHIDYAYGTFSNFPSGTFELMEVTFEAIDTAEETLLQFNFDTPRLTDVTYGGGSVLSGSSGSTVTILENFMIYLPLIMK